MASLPTRRVTIDTRFTWFSSTVKTGLFYAFDSKTGLVR
jgi:hypothetical protein